MENFLESTEATTTDDVRETTPNVNATSESVSATEAVTLTNFKKLKKLKVGDSGLYSLAKIIKGSNIRNESKLLKSLPELMESIAENGIITPLQVNIEGKLIDGFSRHACAVRLELLEVPVYVIDIEDSMIPFYQYLTAKRENLDETEVGLAVFNHTLLNPEAVQLDIAKDFGVSAEFVSRAARIIKKGDVITNSVVKGVITPTTAWNIVDNANENNFLQVEDILEDKLCVIADAEENTEAEPKVIKPISLKILNQELTKAGLQPINRETKVKEDTPKAFDKAKVISFLECLDIKPQGNVALISGAVSIEDWNYIQSLIVRNKKFNINTVTVRDIADEIQTYEDYSTNGECFIQTSSNEYTSFNPLLAELGLALVVENQLEKIKVSKTQLNSVVGKIQMDVTIVNCTKFKTTESRGRKKSKETAVNIEAETISTEGKLELEAGIQADILSSLEQTYQSNKEDENPDTEIVEFRLSEDEDKQEEPDEEEFRNLITDVDLDHDGDFPEDEADISEIGF